jgi:hypothetical protein
LRRDAGFQGTLLAGLEVVYLAIAYAQPVGSTSNRPEKKPSAITLLRFKLHLLEHLYWLGLTEENFLWSPDTLLV